MDGFLFSNHPALLSYGSQLCNIRRLKYFAAVAEGQHFSHAAEQLHISQPSVSRQIKDLEEELGVALLIRDGHKATGLSPREKLFLPTPRKYLPRGQRPLRQ